MFDSLIHIKKAIGTLNPQHVRDLSERPIRIALHASNQDAYRQMEEFFLSQLTPARRRQSALLLARAPIPPSTQPFDLHVYDSGTLAPEKALVFHPHHTQAFVLKVLANNPSSGVVLAQRFVPFRRPFIDRVIAKTARENTLFSISTALPDVIPSIIELPWAVAEFASDTAFLTMNQVRMAFLLAAASDREVGYMQQKAEIASVIGSAFGWRALARQLVGKIPFGGGLIAKAAVAYAGTRVLGLSLERYYSIGFTYTREERDQIYSEAFRQGKQVALKMVSYIRPELTAKLNGRAQQR
ncbi:MAG: hypothetical protein JOY54_14985 [Acidobacteriaceae bacterium]|nr:hypothetical protein [Acidobacteriaceae bacterium]